MSLKLQIFALRRIFVLSIIVLNGKEIPKLVKEEHNHA